MRHEVPDLVGRHRPDVAAGVGRGVLGSDAPLDCAVNMTVAMASAATRRGSAPSGAARPRPARAVSTVSRSSSGACARLTSAGWVSSSRGANSVNSARCASGSGRESSNSSWTAVRSASIGSGWASAAAAIWIGHPAQRVLEQGQQQLVLAVEVLVEAAQRLAGDVDDLLHGEVGGALVGDDGLRGVEEPLDPLLGAELSRPGRPLDRPLLPGRLITTCGRQSRPCSPSRTTPACRERRSSLTGPPAWGRTAPPRGAPRPRGSVPWRCRAARRGPARAVRAGSARARR